MGLGEQNGVAVSDPRTRYLYVGSFGRAEDRGSPGIFQTADPVSPRSGGIDDEASPDLPFGSVQPIANPGSPDPISFLEETCDHGIVGDLRARCRGGPDHRDGQPGVVALGVNEPRSPLEPALSKERFGLIQGSLAQLLMAAHITPPGEPVVDGEPDPNLPGRNPIAVVEWKDEINGPDQVGSQARQDGPLPQGLGNQSDLALLEVAETAMNQPAGA